MPRQLLHLQGQTKQREHGQHGPALHRSSSTSWGMPVLPGFSGLNGAGTGQTDSPVQQGLSWHHENDGPELNLALAVSCGFAALQHTGPSQHTSNAQLLLHAGRSTRCGGS